MRILTFIIHQLSRLRLLLYKCKILKTHSFDIPIISVGNIEHGGTGKTPMVAWLVEHLTCEGYNKKVCVISRGYGRKSNQTIIVNNEKKYTIDEIGDEPFTLINENAENPNISMVISNNKVEAINIAIRTLNIDVIILDDGFQSIYIKRDLDIVMVNNTQKKNINLTREPFLALRRADVIIEKPSSGLPFNNANYKILDSLGAVGYIPKIILRPNAENLIEDNYWARDSQNPTIRPKEKDIHRVVGVCGIANPLSFKETVEMAFKSPLWGEDSFLKKWPRDIFFNMKELITYNDHYNYSEADMEHIYQRMEFHGCKNIITTSKDYYKLEALNKKQVKIYKLRMKLHFNWGKNDNDSEQMDQLLKKVM